MATKVLIIQEISKDFKHYSSNILLKRAVERDLEIIGEALTQEALRSLEIILLEGKSQKEGLYSLHRDHKEASGIHYNSIS